MKRDNMGKNMEIEEEIPGSILKAVGGGNMLQNALMEKLSGAILARAFLPSPENVKNAL